MGCIQGMGLMLATPTQRAATHSCPRGIAAQCGNYALGQHLDLKTK